ncbi:hypothetical protein ElyMa_002548700 [Elysia marginata]|uniref:Uncharacterized protein n=1 Tax=Elysia marginata TaxID=1093978 RepID=A0AAV4GWM3_9GAST|nr:hypothetical protein ElyMa_002548700 [Elysia marginata]
MINLCTEPSIYYMRGHSSPRGSLGVRKHDKNYIIRTTRELSRNKRTEWIRGEKRHQQQPLMTNSSGIANQMGTYRSQTWSERIKPLHCHKVGDGDAKCPSNTVSSYLGLQDLAYFSRWLMAPWPFILATVVF